MVAALGYLDYVTGDLSFIVFYIGPVTFVAWFAGRRWGLFIAGISTIAWVSADLLDTLRQAENPAPPTSALSAWNVIMKLAFLFLVTHAVAALRRAYSLEQAMARTDPLTGAANRRQFTDALQSELHRSSRYRHPLTLAYADIDNFKSVNDRLGHPAGDRLLKTVVETIRATIRETDLLGRLGGDEFALLLPETGSDEALRVLEKCRMALREAAGRNGWPVTFSFGVVTGLFPGSTAEDLLGRADTLLYEAKQAGKDRIRHVPHDAGTHEDSAS
jgi:diguanylate cyclase (GGDEF)-like protein